MIEKTEIAGRKISYEIYNADGKNKKQEKQQGAIIKSKHFFCRNIYRPNKSMKRSELRRRIAFRLNKSLKRSELRHRISF